MSAKNGYISESVYRRFLPETREKLLRYYEREEIIGNNVRDFIWDLSGIDDNLVETLKADMESQKGFQSNKAHHR